MVPSGQLHTHVGLLYHIFTNRMAGTQIHEEQTAVLLPGHFSGV